MIRYHVGYQPGLVGWMVQTQTQFYAQAVGFDQPFECKIASEIAEFVPRHTDRGNLLLCAMDGNQFVGSIVIDGGTTPAARLRWFVVAPAYVGHGIGRALITQALAFADLHHGLEEQRIVRREGDRGARYQRRLGGRTDVAASCRGGYRAG